MNVHLFVALFASSFCILALLIAFSSLCCGGKIRGGGNGGSIGAVSGAGIFIAGGGDGGCGGGGGAGCGGGGGGAGCGGGGGGGGGC